MPVNQYVRPPQMYQADIGFFKKIRKYNLELTLDVYYRYSKDQSDIKPFFSYENVPHIETELINTEVAQYGLEFMMKKRLPRLINWVSLSFGIANSRSSDIQNGVPYPSASGRPYGATLFSSYFFNRKSIFLTWNYVSGAPFNAPSGKYQGIDGRIYPYFGGLRNQNRLPAFHQLDIGISIKTKIKKMEGDLKITLRNVYARKNTYSYLFQEASDITSSQPSQIKVINLYLGTVYPDISYSIKF